MTFTKYLKSQLTDFVDTYKKFYAKTLGATIIFTLITFIIIALLLYYSVFDKTSSKRHISLLSYFFVRYSFANTYSIVDLSKTVFIFFVSIFSIGLVRLQSEKLEKETFNFSDFIKKLKAQDFGYLITALIISIITDYFIVKLDDISAKYNGGLLSDKWIHGMLFIFRMYIPLILFSIANYKALTSKKIILGLKNIFLLFIALWLFNEFAYEVSLFVRGHIFELILIPFPEDKQYLIESILGLSLISFYFLGYYSAMINSMNLLDQDNHEKETQQP